MTPDHWPSFWLGLLAWFALSAGFVILAWLYYELERLGIWLGNLTREAQPPKETT